MSIFVRSCYSTTRGQHAVRCAFSSSNPVAAGRAAGLEVTRVSYVIVLLRVGLSVAPASAASSCVSIRAAALTHRSGF